jgi:hypothetical protein
MLVQYSALFIFAPALVAAHLSRWVDVGIIVAQATASIWYHSSHSWASLFSDRVALAALVVRTLLLAVSTYATMALFVLGFGYMLLIYTYGFHNDCFSFDPRPEVADKYHASIHLLGIAIYTGSMVFFL